MNRLFRSIFLSLMLLKYVSVIFIVTGAILKWYGYVDLGYSFKTLGGIFAMKELSSELDTLKEISDETK